MLSLTQLFWLHRFFCHCPPPSPLQKKRRAIFAKYGVGGWRWPAFCVHCRVVDSSSTWHTAGTIAEKIVIIMIVIIVICKGAVNHVDEQSTVYRSCWS